MGNHKPRVDAEEAACKFGFLDTLSSSGILFLYRTNKKVLSSLASVPRIRHPRPDHSAETGSQIVTLDSD